MAAAKPQKLTIRAYGVGFGDCFLLTFHYAGATGQRHMLIDFGSTERPPNAVKNLSLAVAQDIEKACQKKLHAVVVTHRHKDHISGFDPGKTGKGSGAVIKSLKPDLVIQPWTEDPKAARNATGPAAAANPAFAMVTALNAMNAFSEASLAEAAHLNNEAAPVVRSIGEEGLANLAAVKNLRAMGENVYVHHGKKVPQLARLFPGVKWNIIGPPTIKQKADIVTQRSKHKDEFWHFASFWRLHAASADLAGGKQTVLFPGAASVRRTEAPWEARWFINQVRDLRGEQLMRIVRSMDDALNNTSVILLIEAGKKKLLFPGDAQWENWEFALEKNKAELKDVDVYKVGHHGSLNATPKSLWNLFKGRAGLTTIMSTVTDSKHGSEENESEVPRGKLVTELRKHSRLVTTQQLEPSGKLCVVEEIDL